MTTQEIIREAMESGYAYYGIRIDEDVIYSVGDYTANSRVWVDGDVTDEELDGTSCVGIKYEEDVESAMETADCYYGNCIYIIAGDEMEYGEDNGEYVIKDAVVVAVIKTAKIAA